MDVIEHERSTVLASVADQNMATSHTHNLEVAVVVEDSVGNIDSTEGRCWVVTFRDEPSLGALAVPAASELRQYTFHSLSVSQ